ncbi:MFS transporter [Embleya sp. NPDC050154]|uniref:MFS transporter n=1 Tax=unclassified Embleya TaxID=2699296 RepID=UPI0037A8CDA2
MTTRQAAPDGSAGQAGPVPIRTAAEPGAIRGEGIRLGLLGGPSVFGVTSAGVALPDVGRALDAGPTTVGWVLTAHALALGMGTAVFGRLADARGVRFSLSAGGALLALGMAVCLGAPNLGVLVAGRFLAAAGSGAMVSAALALAVAADPARRARILGGFGGTMAVFGAGATLVGGVVTEWIGWRATLVLPALSLPVIALCLPLIRRAGTGSRRAVDAVGAGLVALTATTSLVLIQSPTLSLGTPAVSALGAGAALALGTLTWWTRRRPHGFVPRALIGDRTIVLTAVMGIGVFGALFSVMYAAPQLLVREYGWSVLQVGAALLPGGLIGFVLARRAVGSRGRGLFAATTVAASAGLLAVGLSSGAAVIVVAASLCIVAFAVSQVVTTGRVATLVDPAVRGGAVGLLNQMYFVGGGMGAAAVGALSETMDPARALALVALLPPLAASAALWPTGTNGRAASGG